MVAGVSVLVVGLFMAVVFTRRNLRDRTERREQGLDERPNPHRTPAQDRAVNVGVIVFAVLVFTGAIVYYATIGK